MEFCTGAKHVRTVSLCCLHSTRCVLAFLREGNREAEQCSTHLLSSSVTSPRTSAAERNVPVHPPHAFINIHPSGPSMVVQTKQVLTPPLRNTFPAHHEVVLNPNIRSAMAVMRCCPGREVQATAVSSSMSRRRGFCLFLLAICMYARAHTKAQCLCHRSGKHLQG